MSLIDAHCHIDPDIVNVEVLAQDLDREYENSGVDRVCLMSSNHLDHHIVTQLADLLPQRIVPSFGLHPWFTHLYSLDPIVGNDDFEFKKSHYQKVFKKDDISADLLDVLPYPKSFHDHWKHLQSQIERFRGHDRNVIVGEIGLDKLFRIPDSGFFGKTKYGEGVPRLSIYKTSFEHQKNILQIQLDYAFDSNLSVSLHNVKAMGVLNDLIVSAHEKFPKSQTNIMLHSYTGSLDSLVFLQNKIGKNRVYISLSQIINGERNMVDFIQKVGYRNVLIESDIYINNHERETRYLTEIDSALGDQVNNVENLNEYLRTP